IVPQHVALVGEAGGREPNQRRKGIFSHRPSLPLTSSLLSLYTSSDQNPRKISRIRATFSHNQPFFPAKTQSCGNNCGLLSDLSPCPNPSTVLEFFSETTNAPVQPAARKF